MTSSIPPPIKGFPELHWTGKRSFRSTVFFPAQLKESFGEPDENGWMNKIFWGDNLQVMSHLLKEYRGQVDLIYIDPPFDSKADYKKKIKIRVEADNKVLSNDYNSFEEKQYGDIWTNDEYLQFMFERLILLKELLSDKGSIYLHCDWHKSHHLRCILDTVFGPNNIRNEIVWKKYSGVKNQAAGKYTTQTDSIFWYSKGGSIKFNQQYRKMTDKYIEDEYKYVDNDGRRYALLRGRGYQNKGGIATKKYLDENPGSPITSLWDDDNLQLNTSSAERLGYPTQKPESLLERIIKASSNPGDLVFDCFMGSGTTQAVALKLGRRFLGADINLGAVHTTTKRLLGIMKLPGGVQTSQQGELPFDGEGKRLPGLEVYNVNNYDIFRNPIEAKELILKALEVQPVSAGQLWDGELDGRMVKVMPVDHIATKADLEGLIANLPYKTYDEIHDKNPNQVVESFIIVCMGHEPDLKDALLKDLSKYKVEIDIVDLRRDKKMLQFKREAEAEVVREGKKLVIRSFYPLNLMQKLSQDKTSVEDWRQLVDSIIIDWNFDGGDTLQPTTLDIPKDKELVKGIYDIPETAGVIRVKITDLLSESLEVEVR